MSKFTADDVLAVARTFDPVTKNPGADEGACYYTHPEYGGHCIAGQVFATLGTPMPLDQENGNAISTLSWLSFHYEWDAIELLRKMQSHADDDNTWGEAIAVATEGPIA